MVTRGKLRRTGATKSPVRGARSAGTRRPPLGIRALAAASLCTTLGVLPPFLLGALSFSIRQEMGFGQARLGAAIAVFFAVSALASIPGGRVADRIGAKLGMSLAVGLSLVGLLGTAALATSWWHLVAFHMLGGCAAGLSSPATSLALARHVPPTRQGLAFGLSKGAGPTATMLAGLAVPAIALTIGWRWAYAIVALGGALFWLVLPDDTSPRKEAAGRDSGTQRNRGSRLPLVILALAVGFGMGATHSMASFFVESAIDRGFDPGFAGSVLAFGSLTGVVGRGVWGWVLDRWQGSQLALVAALMAVGGAATFAFGGVSSGPGLVAVAAVAFGAGWGWSGVFVLAVVRLHPQAPARATGITAAGMFVGGTVGPLTFGTIAHAASYVAMWVVGGVCLLVAAGLVLVARTAVRRHRKGELAQAPSAPPMEGLPAPPT